MQRAQEPSAAAKLVVHLLVPDKIFVVYTIEPVLEWTSATRHAAMGTAIYTLLW